MSQMNPKEVFHNTVYSVQLLYIAGLRRRKISRKNKFVKTKSKLFNPLQLEMGAFFSIHSLVI